MSKYTYVHIGRVSGGSKNADKWRHAIANIDGEIVDTVMRDGYTYGVIVKTNDLNTNV